MVAPMTGSRHLVCDGSPRAETTPFLLEELAFTLRA